MLPPDERPGGDAGAAFQRLVDIMARLRGPGGCPWDHAQTLASLRQFVLEETYEVLDAIDRQDLDDLRGEIGDFLFEGVFLARIAEDDGHFSVADSLQAVCDKLIRRHPHVFGTSDGIDTPARVVEQWEAIKAREQTSKGQSQSLLRGLPKALPALLHAYEIGTRAAAVGFDWDRIASVIGKIEEEVAELRRAIDGEGAARTAEEMGDLLFAMANLSRKLGVDPEVALRRANAKFTTRFEGVERGLAERGRSIQDASLDEMEAEWQRVKTRE